MYIFVYGTLKQGFCNHYLLNESEFICEAITKEKYPMVNTEIYFPYLINRAGEGFHIKGEVYRIDTNTLALLDILEGYPEHYIREEIRLSCSYVEIRALVYFLRDCIEYESLELLEEFTNKEH